MPNDPVVPESLRFKTAFLSHASHDKDLALQFVHELEAYGCRCWISGRDIAPGTTWDLEVIKGLKKCEALVLLLSPAANQSKYIEEEVFHARTAGKMVVTVQLGRFELSERLAFWLASGQIVEAQAALEDLERVVPMILGVPRRQKGESRPPILKPEPEPGPPWGKIGLAVLAIFLISALAYWKMGQHGGVESASKIQWYKADGTTPLDGAIVEVQRGEGLGHGASFISNGVKGAITMKLQEGLLPEQSDVFIEFSARAAVPHQPFLANETLVDPDVIWLGQRNDWLPATKLHDAPPFNYAYHFLDSNHHVAGEAPINVPLWLFVGAKGYLPEGKIPVRLSYYLGSQTELHSGVPLSTTDFTLQVPSPWSLGIADHKLELRTLDDTASLDAAPVPVQVLPPVGRDYSGPALRFCFRPKMLGTPLSGPITFNYYLLNARFSNDQPFPKGGELVVDPATKRKRAYMMDGEYLEFPGSLPSGNGLPANTLLPEQNTVLSFGAQGAVPPGLHPVGIVLQRGEEVIYRTKINLLVPTPWAMPEANALVEVLGPDDRPANGQIIRGIRQPTYIWVDEKQVSHTDWNGVSLPLKIRCKGAVPAGPWSVSFYLRAVTAPAEPKGDATISAGLNQRLVTPTPQGYTYAWTHTIPTPTTTIQDFKVGFMVGDSEAGQGKIPSGLHEVGVLIRAGSQTVYQDVLMVEVK